MTEQISSRRIDASEAPFIGNKRTGGRQARDAEITAAVAGFSTKIRTMGAPQSRQETLPIARGADRSLATTQAIGKALAEQLQVGRRVRFAYDGLCEIQAFREGDGRIRVARILTNGTRKTINGWKTCLDLITTDKGKRIREVLGIVPGNFKITLEEIFQKLRNVILITE